MLAAENDWYGSQDFGGMCLRAEFTPSSLNLVTGQSAGIETRVRQVFENVEVPIHLKIQAGGPCLGTVAPTSVDTAPPVPARFTYTAGNCGAPVEKGSFTVEGVSKRGRVGGRYDNITIRRVPISYVGTIKGSEEANGGGADFERETWTTNDVRFDREPGRDGSFLLADGTVSWTLTGIVGGQCSESGSAILPAVAGTSEGSIEFTDAEYYHAGAAYSRQGPYTLTCPNSPPQKGQYPVYSDWFDSNGNQGYLSAANPDGSLTGTVDVSQGGGSGAPGGTTQHWEWQLTPVY